MSRPMNPAQAALQRLGLEAQELDTLKRMQRGAAEDWLQKRLGERMRQRVIRALENQSTAAARGFAANASAAGLSPAQYFRDLKAHGMADSIAATVLAELGGFHLCVTTGSQPDKAFTLHTVTGEQAKDAPVVHLYNHNNLHYQVDPVNTTSGARNNCLFNGTAQALLRQAEIEFILDTDTDHTTASRISKAEKAALPAGSTSRATIAEHLSQPQIKDRAKAIAASLTAGQARRITQAAEQRHARNIRANYSPAQREADRQGALAAHNLNRLFHHGISDKDSLAIDLTDNTAVEAAIAAAPKR